jgi:hypothetical protein
VPTILRSGTVSVMRRSKPAEPDPRLLLEMVVEALRLSALPSHQQAAVLPDFVHVPDEVALLYEDAWLRVPVLREANLLDDAQYESLARLDQQYEEMSDAADKDWVWTVDAMERDERWARSRQLAKEALAALGHAEGLPQFPGVTWVRARD